MDINRVSGETMDVSSGIGVEEKQGVGESLLSNPDKEISIKKDTSMRAKNYYMRLCSVPGTGDELGIEVNYDGYKEIELDTSLGIWDVQFNGNHLTFTNKKAIYFPTCGGKTPRENPVHLYGFEVFVGQERTLENRLVYRFFDSPVKTYEDMAPGFPARTLEFKKTTIF